MVGNDKRCEKYLCWCDSTFTVLKFCLELPITKLFCFCIRMVNDLRLCCDMSYLDSHEKLSTVFLIYPGKNTLNNF